MVELFIKYSAGSNSDEFDYVKKYLDDGNDIDTSIERYVSNFEELPLEYRNSFYRKKSFRFFYFYKISPREAALEVATSNNQLEIANMILERFYDDTSLIFAISTKNVESVEKLIKCGSKISIQTRNRLLENTSDEIRAIIDR